MNRKKLFQKFKKLGWGNDAQSKSIFNFLMKSRKQVPEKSILLDLGAGECRYKFFFDHYHYLSIDSTKGNSLWNYSQLDFIGDICHLDFIRDKSVDFCLNTTTLEHISEPFLFFAQVERILKPGGRLFLYVPFVMPEHQIPYDFFRYTSYGLRYLCQKNKKYVTKQEAINSIIRCPICKGSLNYRQNSYTCSSCQKIYKITNNQIRF